MRLSLILLYLRIKFFHTALIKLCYVGNFISVVVCIADQDAFSVRTLDVAVAVADAEGNDTVIGFHLPGKRAEFFTAGKKLRDLRNTIIFRKACLQDGNGASVQFLKIADECDLFFFIVKQRDIHIGIGNGEEPTRLKVLDDGAVL